MAEELEEGNGNPLPEYGTEDEPGGFESDLIDAFQTGQGFVVSYAAIQAFLDEYLEPGAEPWQDEPEEGAVEGEPQVGDETAWTSPDPAFHELARLLGGDAG